MKGRFSNHNYSIWKISAKITKNQISENMKKSISVSKEGIAKLQKAFRIDGKPIGERCVRNALAYRQNNDLARKIRFAALKHYGGCTYYDLKEGEFFFDSDSCARAVYPNGAEVYLDKQTGVGTIYDPKGNVVAEYDNVMVSQIPSIQERAMAL